MYLAIDGVIGVGKTSLARLLQPAFDAEVLLEVFEENPFLSDFYSDRARYAFQTQIFFLLSRYHQQRAVPTLLERGSLIADYTFAKDALFARINLSGEDLTLYRQLHDALAEKIPRPALTVYLRAPTPMLLERIARRGREYERQIDPTYIAELGAAYDDFFAAAAEDGRQARVLIIETEHLDFVNRTEDLRLVTKQIQKALGLGAVQVPLPLEGDR
ncbi:MAG: deoxynucleoside kinase [Anaerolineales bacterium]|nr:deoxynucleoside kinase [Anaerolineales bacterium]